MTNWTIEKLDRQTSDGFVTTAYWRATAVDGEFTATIYGSCSWTPEAPVIPYANLVWLANTVNVALAVLMTVNT